MSKNKITADGTDQATKLESKKFEGFLFVALFVLGITYIFSDNMFFEEMVIAVRNLYFQMLSSLGNLNELTRYSERFFPFIVTVLFLAIVFMFKEPKPRGVKSAVIIVTFALHTAYIIFRVGTLNLRDPASTVTSSLLYATEIFYYLMMCCFYLQMVWPINRSRQADKGEKLIRSSKYTPTVAMFVPTYDEPVDLLRRTLVGCQAVEYPCKNVYLLDDTNRPEMRELASELGCRYIARTDNTNAKAGNLNNALSQTDEELIAFFDCDNIPTKNFLYRLVGFFHDPKVAMTISSLHYYNAQENTKNIGIEMLIATDHAKSLSNSQTGRDFFNALLCFGTSYIIRRKPLEEIGGIPTETLCEDWATSIVLQSKGYKTYFLDEVLSSGMAAENLGEFVQQRLRWCQGTLQSMYASSNPLRIKGFNLGQRFVHFFGVFYYLMYPITLVAMLIPLLYFFFGIVPIEASVAQFTFFFLPFFLMQNMMYIFFSKRPSSIISSQIYDYIMCVPLTIVTMKTFLKPFGQRFRVTQKGITSDKISPLHQIGLPLLFLFLLYLGAIIFGANNVVWYGVGAPFLVYSFWCVYRMIFFWMSFQASINLPQKRKTIRFDQSMHCHLFNEQGEFIADSKVMNISDSGLEIVVNIATIPDSFLISFPALSMGSVQVRVARSICKRDDGCFGYGLEFTNLTPDQYRKIIEFIYCEPGTWGSKVVTENMAIRALTRFFSKVK